MEWYALFVKTGKEEAVQQWLHFHFEESVLYSIVPKRKLIEKRSGKAHKVIKKVFPGYVLINTSMDDLIYYKIRNIPNIIKILSSDTYYSKIDEQEIVPLLELIDENNIINISTIYKENAKIFVKSGPLCGMEGIIKKINKHSRRAKILLNFMGEPRIIDVGIDVLYKSV